MIDLFIDWCLTPTLAVSWREYILLLTYTTTKPLEVRNKTYFFK